MATFLDKVIHIYYFKKEIAIKKFCKKLYENTLRKDVNILVEPKWLFKGRGKQSLARTFKKEIYAEEIILDIHPDELATKWINAGHSYGEIVDNKNVAWIVY